MTTVDTVNTVTDDAVDRSTCTARLHATKWAYRLGCRCPDVYPVMRPIWRQQAPRQTPRRTTDHSTVQVALIRCRNSYPPPPLGILERRAVVAQLTREGWSAKAIGEAINLAPRSVQRHRAHTRAANIAA